MKKRKVNKIGKRSRRKLIMHGAASSIIIGFVLLIGIMAAGAFLWKPGTPNNAIQPTQTPEDKPIVMQTFDVTNTPEHSCSNAVTDTMLIMDASLSMNSPIKMGGTKLTRTRAAAKKFVDMISANPESRVGLVTFNIKGYMGISLSSDFASVKDTITAIKTKWGTCIQCGIRIANQDIFVNKRSGIKQNAIILSDGIANIIWGGTTMTNPLSIAEKAARNEAKIGTSQSDITFYTIGFGDMNKTLLTNIAKDSGGKAYISPDDSKLDEAFEFIAQSICSH